MFGNPPAPGDPNEEDLLRIRTRKAEAPVLTVTMGDGSTRRVWCTFGPQQIDINPFSAPGGGLLEFKSGLRLPKSCRVM